MSDKKEDEKKDNKITFKARSRLILLLGEQLITDEVAAVSELVKNSYDADAKKVHVELSTVSQKDKGRVIIKDNGHGMTKDHLLESWLQLGAISKFRKNGEEPRVSEDLKRLYLGEKGLGRLAVHKIGWHVEIVTRRKCADDETIMILDLTNFEDENKFLDDIEIFCEERSPQVFDEKIDRDFPNGTKITITNLQRNWSSDRIERVKDFLWSIQSPFAPIKDFEVTSNINDQEEKIDSERWTTEKILDTSHYKMMSSVDEKGIATMHYRFNSPLYPENKREKTWDGESGNEPKLNFEKGYLFPHPRETECGPFKVSIYCWELDPKHRKKTFNKGDVFAKYIKPQTGMKVLRDNFRVFPYGNEDNDWLAMDQKRISQFRFNVSRNQIMGFVEISSKTNPKLIDKSDREGLIDNEAFRDFKFLILSVLRIFEAERKIDRDKTKQTQRLDPRLNKIAKQLKRINEELDKQKIPQAGKERITEVIDSTMKSFEKIIEEIEIPLLGAASIGLTYLLPTHELKRNINEALKILKSSIRNNGENFYDDAKKATEQLDEAIKIIRGLTRLQEKEPEAEDLKLKTAIENASSLMEKKMQRNEIQFEIIDKLDASIVTDRQSIIIMLVNIIDNSIHWVSSNTKSDRKIRFLVDEISGSPAIVVSDNGPGFEDDLETVTDPFFTRKTGGLGLGLFICSRVAEQNNYLMKILSEDENPHLLSGASIAIIFKMKKK